MAKENSTVYKVIYKDDKNRTHMTFTKDFSSIKFIEERFGDICFEKVNYYVFLDRFNINLF